MLTTVVLHLQSAHTYLEYRYEEAELNMAHHKNHKNLGKTEALRIPLQLTLCYERGEQIHPNSDLSLLVKALPESACNFA